MAEGTCDAARPQPVADGEGDVVCGADVQDLIPVHVRKVLGVVQQAQLRSACTAPAQPLQQASPQTLGPSSGLHCMCHPDSQCRARMQKPCCSSSRAPRARSSLEQPFSCCTEHILKGP